MNNLALSVALATAPSSAFAELRERPRSTFPLLLLVALGLGIACWYYSVVDVEWLKQAIYANDASLAKLPDEQRAQGLAMITRNTLMATALIGALIFLPVFFLLQSVYLLVAAKVTKLPQGFGHWFAFSCWSALPALIGIVVAAVLLLLADNTQIDPAVLQPLSLNELVFHRPIGSPGYALLETLQIPSILSWLLMIVGVRAWSGRSWLFSAVFVLLPVAVVYGIWAAFAFR